jgi:predicted SAM-dependent methyltransferase
MTVFTQYEGLDLAKHLLHLVQWTGLDELRFFFRILRVHPRLKIALPTGMIANNVPATALFKTRKVCVSEA